MIMSRASLQLFLFGVGRGKGDTEMISMALLGSHLYELAVLVLLGGGMWITYRLLF